jgi:hypothetical protein
MSGFIKRAQTLTLLEWREEIYNGTTCYGRIFDAFLREIDSFPQREPMLSLVKRLCLDTKGPYPFHSNWIIPNVTVSEHLCSFPTNVYFWGETTPFKAGRSHITGVHPLFEASGDQEREMYVIGVEAILRINDDAQMSSEIVETFTETDPDRWRIDWDNPDGWLFSMEG